MATTSPSHLDRRISRRSALLLVPVLVTVHNTEEALAMPGALRTLPGRVPGAFAQLIPTLPQFLVALAVVTAIPWLVWLFGVARRERRTAVVALLLMQAVMLVNAAWHVGAAVFLRGYAPGVATAMALNLPFGIYLLRHAVADGWIARRTVPLLIVAAAIIHGPGVFGVMWIAGRIAGS